jgi:hypothetical protein
MAKRVYLLTRDLLFHSKLGTVVTAAGALVTRDAAACDGAVVEIGATDWEARLRDLMERHIPTVAFGPHVDAERLRLARASGAVAVPNSQVESRLRVLLAGPETETTPGNPGS